MLPNILEEDVFATLRSDILNSEQMLLCCDYDGTLVGFTSSPKETKTPEEVLDLLRDLRDSPKYRLAIVSGRSLAKLKQLVDIPGITLAGLHGIEISFPDGEKFVWDKAERLSERIEALYRDFLGEFGDLEGVLVETKKYAAAVHYRQFRGDGQEIKRNFMRIATPTLGEDLEILEGSKIYEVRPRDWDKGSAVGVLQEELNENSGTIYLGDDTTDEDAFRHLSDQEGAYPIIVSEDEEPQTHARYQLSNPQQVHRFLLQLIDIPEESG